MHYYHSSEEQALHTWKSIQKGGMFDLVSRTGRLRLPSTNAPVELTIKVAHEEALLLTNMTLGNIILDTIVESRPPHG